MGLLIKLQNGDTALKSLKFGNDRPGGGDSGQPYIKDPILDNPLPESKDFLLRGGLNAPTDAAQDVVRLTKYMFDLKSPSGLLFTAKQNLLSRTAPKTEASKGIGYAGGALNEGVYTPLSTLAQAGVGFAGIHLNKQGIDPTGLLPGLSINKYNDVVTFDQPSEKNKLVNLSQYSLKNFNGIKGYDLNQGNDVITYGGGPGSVLGVGRTHIRHADQRTGINNPLSSTNKKYFYDGGLTRPNSDNKTPGGGVDYNYLLGVSKKENLTEFETGINSDGNFTTLYSPSLPYSTLSKYNPTGQSLSGSNGYQIGDNLKYQTQEKDAIFKSFPIEDRLISYNRQLLSPIVFDTGRISGNANTWAVTSDSVLIPKYTSKPTLFRDYSDIDVKNAGGGLWKEFNNGTTTHKEGYLADLDKNAGTWETSHGIQLNNNNAYPGGVAPDFRKTPRTKRGLYELPLTAQNEKFDKPIPGYDNLGTGETYSEYHEKNGRLKKNTLQRIYYKSNESSFKTSNLLNKDNDLISFNFGIINPTNPSDITTLYFRAYIDNFSDTYNADWKPQTYMGRAEKFYKYGSFDRSISLGFTIVADNETNLTTMYNQLNTLAASLAPTYTTYGYMAGNLHRLTVGNYVSNQVGIMDGLTYEVTDESPWEINAGSQLPMYIKVTGIKFTPIHDFRPESQFNTTHQFIKQ
jgi:hypothetical protein